MGRRRTSLVPKSGVECFEVRIVLYFDEDGIPMIAYDVDKPDHSGAYDVPMHEALGVLSYASQLMMLDHVEAGE
jgi:hypothetical protein